MTVGRAGGLGGGRDGGVARTPFLRAVVGTFQESGFANPCLQGEAAGTWTPPHPCEQAQCSPGILFYSTRRPGSLTESHHDPGGSTLSERPAALLRLPWCVCRPPPGPPRPCSPPATLPRSSDSPGASGTRGSSECLSCFVFSSLSLGGWGGQLAPRLSSWRDRASHSYAHSAQCSAGHTASAS